MLWLTRGIMSAETKHQQHWDVALHFPGVLNNQSLHNLSAVIVTNCLKQWQHILCKADTYTVSGRRATPSDIIALVARCVALVLFQLKLLSRPRTWALFLPLSTSQFDDKTCTWSHAEEWKTRTPLNSKYRHGTRYIHKTDTLVSQTVANVKKKKCKNSSGYIYCN